MNGLLTIDFDAVSHAWPWLYPFTVLMKNLVGLARVNLLWLLVLGVAIVLLVTLDRAFTTNSSVSRQSVAPSVIVQDLSIFYLQLGLARLAPAVFLVVAWSALAPRWASALRSQFELADAVRPLPAVAPAMLVVAVAVAQDLARYLSHRLQHRVACLWELHKFHHSAPSLCVLTAYREHPLLLAMNNLFSAVAASLVATPALLLWPALLDRPVEIVGGLLAFVAFKALFLLGHFHRPVSYGPLDRWVVSPAVHAIHHSADPTHHDKNFGGLVTLWDRLFKTYHAPVARELASLRYGIDETSRETAGRLLPWRYLYVTLTVRAARQLTGQLARRFRPGQAPGR